MKTDATATILNQWRDIRNWATAAAVLFLLLTLDGTVRAQVTNIIYQDSFARTGQLVGTAPDTVDTGGARWQGGVPPNGIVTDGTEAAVTNRLASNPWATAYLPIQIETGHVYTVSCSIFGNPSDGNQWLSYGFAVAPGQGNTFNSGNVGVAWLLSRCANNGCQFFGGAGTGNGAGTLTYGALSTFMNYNIVLNTATNPAKWSVSFYTNGVFAGTASYASIPTAENGTWIGYVGLGETSNARGNFKNFSVTDVVPAPAAPTILEQPNNLTAQVGQAATFWVAAAGPPDPTYQWMTNGVNIPGATNAIYTTPPLSSAYNGMNYSVTVSNPAGSVPSSSATLTVNPGQPTVFSATKTANSTSVVVMFSSPVDAATALNTANYSLLLNGAPAGVSITSASFGSSSNNVILTTSALSANAGYYLSVQNVQDRFGEAITTSTNIVLPAGLVVYLRGDSGVELDSNGKVAQWLDQTTNGNNAGQFLGLSQSISGAFVPGPLARPTTGSIGVNSTPALTFTAANTNFMTVPYSPSLAVNGNQTLYVFANPDFSLTRDFINENVGNLPASFDFQANANSGVITLQHGDGSFNSGAGSGGVSLSGTENLWAITSQDLGTNATGTTVTNQTFFYINGQSYGVGSTLNNLGAPGDVYAQKPLYIGGRQDRYPSAMMNGQMGEILVFNRPLSGADRTNVDNYFGQKYYSFVINNNLASTTTSSNGFAVTYSIGAGQGPLHINYQWQVNGTNIPGATGQSYTTGILGPQNSNTTYDVVMTLPNGTTYTSAVNTLLVVPASPFVTSAGIPLWEATSSTNIIVLFDVAVDPTTATVAGNYSLASGPGIQSAAMGLEPNKVILTTTAPLAAWNANPGSYSLQVQNVQNVYGQTIVTASSSVGIYPASTALWLESGAGVITDSGANTVNEWNDQSGLGDNLYQFSGVAQEPFLVTNANGHGLPAIQFVGTNTISGKYTTALTSANNSGNDYPPLEITGDVSVFAVVNFNTLANGTNGEIVGKLGSGINNHQPAPYDYYVNAADADFLRGNGTNNGQIVATNTAPSLGYPHVLGVNETGSFVSQYLDLANVGTNFLGGAFQESSTADQGQQLCIGEREDNVNRLNGSMSELILIGSAVDSNDLAAIQSYLAAKYFIPTGSNSYPVITQEPMASTNIDQDSTLVVPAAATGVPLYLQWFDTNNVAQAGQTNATLTINNIQTSDSYYLIATNIFGAVTSSVVTVTVYSGLNVALGPPSVTLYAGLPYTFTAQALGTAPIYYQWYQGASPIPNATNATYSTVASLGSTTYSCLVTNGYNGYSSTNAGPVTLVGIAAPNNAFSQAVLSDGPIAYWRLNEPAGSTIAYDYVGGYNGVYGTNTTNGLPGVPLPGFSGELGVSMDNTVTNPGAGYVTTPGVNVNANTVTFLCWAYPFSAAETNSAGLIFYRVNGTVAGYQFANNNVMSYNWNNVPATYQSSSGLTVAAGTWSLVGVVITPSNAVIYVNGAASAPNNVTNASLSLAAAGFAIGADPQSFTLPSRIFNGEMDEAAIFNYTLSASQMQQLYNAATTLPVNTNPTNIVFSTANNQLTLSWPADHTGWQLQAQTNSLSVGISTNWVNVNGTTGTNRIIIPINLTNGSVFYRLAYP